MRGKSVCIVDPGAKDLNYTSPIQRQIRQTEEAPTSKFNALQQSDVYVSLHRCSLRWQSRLRATSFPHQRVDQILNMALQFTRESTNEFTITAYELGSVRVGDVTFTQSIALAHSTAAHAWTHSAVLDADALRHATTLGCEIVLIGTGTTHRFPKPEALRPLIEARIGFEVMDSRAACRTYNVLLSEGRKVGLLLVV